MYIIVIILCVCVCVCVPVPGCNVKWVIERLRAIDVARGTRGRPTGCQELWEFQVLGLGTPSEVRGHRSLSPFLFPFLFPFLSLPLHIPLPLPLFLSPFLLLLLLPPSPFLSPFPQTPCFSQGTSFIQSQYRWAFSITERAELQA